MKLEIKLQTTNRDSQKSIQIISKNKEKRF